MGKPRGLFGEVVFWVIRGFSRVNFDLIPSCCPAAAMGFVVFIKAFLPLQKLPNIYAVREVITHMCMHTHTQKHFTADLLLVVLENYPTHDYVKGNEV